MHQFLGVILMQFEADSSSEFQTCSNYKRTSDNTKEIIALSFSINIALGKFQESNTSLSLVLNTKASLHMVCSAQHQITIFKQQLRRVGKNFHCREGEGVLGHFITRATNQASFVTT